MVYYFYIMARLILSFVFCWSFATKALALEEFTVALQGFQLVSPRYQPAVAGLVLAGELLSSVLLLLGGALTLAGFGLALLLLLGFTLGLASVLRRGMLVHCHCFGRAAQPVSRVDIVRNIGLLAWAGAGAGAYALVPAPRTPVSLVTWGLLALAALAFVAVWTQLGEIARLFQTS
jgi:hypothetical protein